jgi:hydrogenase maturation protease
MRDAFSEADRRARLSPVRILGIGSPFGADRIGWEVAGALARERWLAALPPGLVSVACADRPGIRLLELLEHPGLVILIDALQGGAAPGTVRCFDGRDLPPTAGFATTHDFGIKAALDLAGALGGIAPEIRVFGIEIGDGSCPPAPAFPPAGPSGSICDPAIINDIKVLVENHLKEQTGDRRPAIHDKEPTHARNP